MAILGTVTPGRERYCPILSAHLDQMWVGHGPMYFALPAGRTAPYGRVIQSDATTWTGTLLYGLEYLKNTVGGTYVFVLLEDHVPLRPCDPGLIANALDVVEAEDLKCVFFTKYDWPWESTDYRLDEDGRVIGWREIDIVAIRGHRMARMPRDFFRYNQCQPAIWNLDYYIEVVKGAVRRGISDPWRFEAYVMPDQPQHYVSEYKWPSWSNGYLDQGKIDWRAVRLMKMPEARVLRNELLREHFKGVPLKPDLLYVLGECVRYSEQLRALPGRIARRVGRSLRAGA